MTLQNLDTNANNGQISPRNNNFINNNQAPPR